MFNLILEKSLVLKFKFSVFWVCYAGILCMGSSWTDNRGLFWNYMIRMVIMKLTILRSKHSKLYMFIFRKMPKTFSSAMNKTYSVVKYFFFLYWFILFFIIEKSSFITDTNICSIFLKWTCQSGFECLLLKHLIWSLQKH